MHLGAKDVRKPIKTQTSGSYWQFSLWMWVWGREAFSGAHRPPPPSESSAGAVQNREPLNTYRLHNGIHQAGSWQPDSSEDAGQGAKTSRA